MSHKQQKNKQPHLAVANMPFTPMTHKIEKPTATPYRPLQVNDLATPKINKSHSSVDKIEMIALQPEPQPHIEQQLLQEHQLEKQYTKPTHQQIQKYQKINKRSSNVDDAITDKENENLNDMNDTSTDLKDLKNALYTCLQVVERLENKEKEEELRRKTYKNIQIQTSPLPPKITNRTQRKQSSNQLPENINTSNEINSDNNLKAQKHYNNINKISSGVKQGDEKANQLANGSAMSDNGDNDLQEKMKAMTILLQKLQSRIDEIDNSNQK